MDVKKFPSTTTLSKRFMEGLGLCSEHLARSHGEIPGWFLSRVSQNGAALMQTDNLRLCFVFHCEAGTWVVVRSCTSVSQFLDDSPPRCFPRIASITLCAMTILLL